MKLRYINAFIVSAGVALSLTSCSEEASVVSPQGREITLSVNVTRGDQSTRSILSEEAGDLKCAWESTDLILVTDGSGKSLGVLKYKDGEDNAATFEGTITTTDTGTVSYNFLYLGAKTETELMALSNPLVLDYSEQDGTMEWLSSHDFFSASTQVVISDSRIEVEDVNLTRQIAFGRFEISMPEGITYAGQDITISGNGLNNLASVSNTGVASFATKADNNTITISGTSGTSDIYVAILPGTEKITPTFSVEIDDVTYSATLDERQWSASEYVRLANADGTSYSGIKLAMTDPNGGNDDDDDDTEDLVGPAFKVTDSNGNDVWVKFTRANLHYNVTEDLWYLPEKQTDFLKACGWKVLNGESSKSNEKMDLFRWGATGLENARQADFFKDKASSSAINLQLPTADESLNSELYTYSDKSFKGTQYDWGKAYGANHPGNYFTLTDPELRSIIDNNCVVLGTVDGVQGAILTDNTNFAALKTMVGNQGLSKLSSAESNSSIIGWNVTITYDQLTSLNGVFFPAVGYHDYNKSFEYNGIGRYWTSSLGNSSPMAQHWNFNATSAKVFRVEGGSKGFAMSVRLVKQVKAPANN